MEVLGGTLQITDNASLVGFAANTLGKGTWRVQGGTLVFSGTNGVQAIGPSTRSSSTGPGPRSPPSTS